MSGVRQLLIFISSPSDVLPERVVARLAQEFASDSSGAFLRNLRLALNAGDAARIAQHLYQQLQSGF